MRTNQSARLRCENTGIPLPIRKASVFGTALLVTVAILSGMAILAFSFAMMTHLEQIASASHTTISTTLEQFHNSRWQFSIQHLREANTRYSRGLAYSPIDASIEDWWFDISQYARETYPKDTTSFGGPTIYFLGSKKLLINKTWVIDCASQLNINMSHDRLASMLDTLFDEIDIDVGDGSIDGSGIDSLSGQAVVDYRSTLGGSFTSKEQLEQIPDGDNDGTNDTLFRTYYEKIEPFLTISSWVNPTTVRADLTSEPRAPVNINTAPRPVLVAVLNGLSADFDGNGTDDVTIGIDMAREIAYMIMKKRDPIRTSPALGSADPYLEQSPAFHTWDATDPNSFYGPFDSWTEFYDFIFALQSGTQSGEDASDPLDVSGYGLQHAILLASNFNPNTRSKLVNPNRSFYLYPENIVRKEGKDVITNHSTEFCFTSYGRFEVRSETRLFTILRDGRVSSASTSRLVDSSAFWADDQYNGYYLLIYDGTGRGQIRAITDTDSSNNYLDVTPNFTVTPDTSSRYAILASPPEITEGRCVSATSYYMQWDPTPSDGSDVPLADQWNLHDLLLTSGSGSPSLVRITDTEIQSTNQRLYISPAWTTQPSINDRFSILGYEGLMTTSAIVQLCDVIYHSRQSDFDGGTLQTDVGGNLLVRLAPEPSDFSGSGVTASTADGFICLADAQAGATTFYANYRENLDSEGGSNPNTGTASVASMNSGGDMRFDGVYTRYDTDSAQQQYVRYTTIGFNEHSSAPGSDDQDGNGNIDYTVARGTATFYVKLGTSHNSTESDQRFDLLVVREPGPPSSKPFINVRGRNQSGTFTITLQIFDRDNFDRDLDGASDPINVNLNLNVGNLSWSPGEWHQIRFGFRTWIECDNDDNDNDTFACDDDPAPDGALDADEGAKSTVKLYVDGTASGDNFEADTDAAKFFVFSGLNSSSVKMTFGWNDPNIPGHSSYANPEATFDQIRIINQYIDPSSRNHRYKNPGASGYTYTSQPIQIPAGVLLGTVSWTEYMPTTYSTDNSDITVRITLGSTTSDVFGSGHTSGNQGEGSRILSSGQAMRSSSTSNLTYTVYFIDPQTSIITETPILDDITITYLRPDARYLSLGTE